MERFKVHNTEDEWSIQEFNFEANLSDYLASIGFDPTDETQGQAINTLRVINTLKENKIINFSPSLKFFFDIFENHNVFVVNYANGKVVGLVDSFPRSVAVISLNPKKPQASMESQEAKFDIFTLDKNRYTQGFIAVSKLINGGFRGSVASFNPTKRKLSQIRRITGTFTQEERFVSFLKKNAGRNLA